MTKFRLLMATAAHPHPGITVESADSPLGRWTIARWAPPATSQLAGIVEGIWYFDGATTHLRERVFPDGRGELIVMLDDPHRDADALAPFPVVCINGLRTRPEVVVAPPGRFRVLGIRFDPLGACLLLRSSMKPLVDVTIDLRDGVGRAAAELGERCAAAADQSPWNPARNAAAAVSAAAEWTLHNLDADVAQDPIVDWTASAIRASHGTISLDAVVSHVNVQRSRLAQRFCDRIGVTPKRFARIVRFHTALTRLTRPGGIAAAAADLAYYDQAHLYRDFAEFAGMTPGDFLAANRYPGSASLAEV